MTSHVEGRPAMLTRRLSPRRFLTRWGPALPLLVFTTATLVLPAIMLVYESFALPDGGLGFEHITKVASNPVDRQAIGGSLALGVVQATLATAIGAPAAWLITRMRLGGRAFWLSLMNVASNFAGIGLAFGFVALIGSTGMLTLILKALLGVEGNPFPSTGSFNGMNLVYLYFNVPMFVLLTLPALSVLKNDWQEAAEVCKATRWQFWRYVGIPVLSPFVIAGWLLVFTWTIGVYAVAYAVAASPGSQKLITLQIGTTLETSVFGLGRAAVLSVLLMILAIGATVLYRLCLKRAARWL
ncbi:ABC transporter permease [Nonomuraea endophytica]|uniref:Putative spermidine/putrescine transport system permease protein n=1 Tax=Nonomuraea endophytica TaxID=714136 RepID=A0A7W8EE46_9ACTN|nr:ABC transporter permease subunit [Nonomuraea endophytica]MBB5076224.1 putative spermidine/putrescine transport system permease protein [Nonomuraea endophytica]